MRPSTRSRAVRIRYGGRSAVVARSPTFEVITPWTFSSLTTNRRCRSICRAPWVTPGMRWMSPRPRLSVVADRVSSFDEMLTTLVQAALAEVTTRQNADMRKISAGAALVLVPTLIAGVYGMNFDQMPELHWVFGYPFALLLMLGSSGYLYWRFKRSGWL